MTKNKLYEQLKSKRRQYNGQAESLLGKENTYWVGAGAISMLFFGFIDGGLSVAIAYGAKKLHENKVFG